ncbi:hypothetical protein [Parasedimentitalea huanghaiensis]|uniref:Uncharacterized protein n=1 Tax=Parasedimentitalea huanghaiensis TaxID=2682100 RepID=A0A6L6WB89_9RHOB|nr:hypothetical protein [Zongyanglinia huanghaiensis]MVO14810.1 hypothetical protein [Zongyanglinia huanghaiensis]
MARHTLKNSVAKLDGSVIDGLRQIDIEETVGDVDLTAAGDSWQDHDTTVPGWTASLSFLLDHMAGANQSLRAGDVVTFEGYTEGDGSGKTYYSGTVSILSMKLGGSHDGEATREYSGKGKGALSIAAVA